MKVMSMESRLEDSWHYMQDRRKPEKNIVKNKRNDGLIATDPNNIIGKFEEFYSMIYLEDAPYPSTGGWESRGRGDIGKIAPELNRDLEANITLEEVMIAMYSLASGKAPGPNRIPLELYKVLHSE